MQEMLNPPGVSKSRGTDHSQVEMNYVGQFLRPMEGQGLSLGSSGSGHIKAPTRVRSNTDPKFLPKVEDTSSRERKGKKV